MLSMFNMWDRQMDVEEIRRLGCRAKGNIVNWDTLQVQSDDRNVMSKETFPCNGSQDSVL